MQQAGVGASDKTGLVLAIGVDIVVREGVALTIRLVLVDDAGVLVIGVRLVVRGGRQLGLDVAAVVEERAPVERRAEPGNDGLVDVVVSLHDGKGTRVAAKDVGGRGLGVASVVTLAEEVVATLDGAVDQARVGLTVDRQRLGCVLGPLYCTRLARFVLEMRMVYMTYDLVNVRVEVVTKGASIVAEVDVGGNNSQRSAVGISHAQVTPWLAIRVTLSNKIAADSGDGIRTQALSGLHFAASQCQRHAHDETNKVDKGEVCPNALGEVGQLDEAPVDVGRGILGVGKRWLDKLDTIRGDSKEVKLSLCDPDTCRTQVSGKLERGAASLSA